MNKSIVPIFYVAELVDLIVSEENVSAREVLRGSDISEHQLSEADALISYAQMLKVYQNAINISSKPGIGLRLGARYQPQHHGVLGHALLCAESIGDSLRLVSQYAKIRGIMFDMIINDASDIVSLTIPDRLPLGPEVHQVAVEEILAMLAPRGSSNPLSLRPIDISIDYPAPAHRKQYEALFDCPIYFSADTLTIRLSKQYLSTPSNMPNAEMVQICEERCKAILMRLGAGGNTVERVRSHLVRAGRDFGIEAIAKSIGMAPRTLRRKLSDEGTTYRDVVADFRKSLALDYLESTDFTMDEIADLLGYGDTSNFSRAFRAWTSESPAHYRRRIREE
ncbi:AraC family transcriptional regulator [Maricurvus nonylphenolicus]|uniref:AraC family transcriptional regulator n=1 Tax=Maricurvus nonylphenolicus TaxID=1008307 RepID=UPI0036F33ACD